jgi:hypothetical protein
MDEGATNLGGRQALHPQVNLDASTNATVVRSRARSISQALPSLRISTSPTSVSPPPIHLSDGVLSTQNKAPGEWRKLLAHLLSRLGARPQAPSVYDELKADSARRVSHGLGVVVETVKSAVRFKANRELSIAQGADKFGEEDSAVENEQGFSTDVTYNYMVQLRDVLIHLDRHAWQILDATFVSILIHTVYS